MNAVPTSKMLAVSQTCVVESSFINYHGSKGVEGSAPFLHYIIADFEAALGG